jgi:hypothetical protein
VAGSYGPAVRRWARRELRITFGYWQARAIDKALRHDRKGDLIHRTILWSTARQNGKSVIIRAFYGWLFDEGHKLPAFAPWKMLLAAAHDAKQARLIYDGVYTDLDAIPRLTKGPERKRGDKGVKPPIILTRQLGIRSEALFFDIVTAEPGSIRGKSAGAIAFDEVLTQRDFGMYRALSPAQSAQRNALLLLTSTAGMADSVVLRQFYDRLRKIATGAEAPDPSFYGAWWESEDPDAGLDWVQIGQANPALGDGRLTRAAIRSEYNILPSDSWRGERLNHWIDVVAPGAFNPHVWAQLRTPDPLAGLDGPYVLGVDVQPGWEHATVTVAGVRPDGRVGVQVYRELEKVTADQVIEAVQGFPDLLLVQAVVYDSNAGGASAFERHADGSWLPWRALKPSEVVAACMDVTEMILSGRLAVDDPLIDSQIAHTGRRPVGVEGAFRFSRHASEGAIDAVLAMTFAAHGILSLPGAPRIS